MFFPGLVSQAEYTGNELFVDYGKSISIAQAGNKLQLPV